MIVGTRLGLCGLLALLLVATAYSDSVRKSISVLNRLEYIPTTTAFETELGWQYKNIPKSVSPSLGSEEAHLILETVKESLTLDRFDVNLLPDQFQALDTVTLNYIRNILEVNALERSQQFIDETDRQRFLAQKAKELAITEEDLRAIMRSAYVCAPFSHGIIVEDGRGVLDVTVNVGFNWYGLQFSDQEVKIRFVGAVESNGWAATSMPPKDKGKRRVRQLELLRSATTIAASRAAQRSLSLDAFALENLVASNDLNNCAPVLIGGSTIAFWMGREDGVSMDDRYKIFEKVISADGSERMEYVGFARVCHVGSRLSTPPTPSRAEVIHKKRAMGPGMTLAEHPRLPYEQRLGIRVKTAQISAGRLAAGGTTYFEFPDKTLVFGALSYGWTASLAGGILGLRQTFLGIDLLVGLSDFDPITANGTQKATELLVLFGFELFAHKRFFSGPLQVAIEGGGLGYYFGQGGKVPAELESQLKSVSYRTESFAAYCAVGLEYALSIDLNLGLSIARWTGNTDSWTLDLESSEGTKFASLDNSDKPRLDFSGIEFRLHFTYSAF